MSKHTPSNWCARCVWVNVVFFFVRFFRVSFLCFSLSHSVFHSYSDFWIVFSIHSVLVLVFFSLLLLRLCPSTRELGPVCSYSASSSLLFLSFVVLCVISHSRFVYTRSVSHTDAPRPRHTYTRALVSIRLFDALVVVAHWLFDTLSIRSFHSLYYFLFFPLLLRLCEICMWPVVGLPICVFVCVCVCTCVHVCSFFLSIFRWNSTFAFLFSLNSHQKRNHMHKLGFNQIDWFVYNSSLFSSVFFQTSLLSSMLLLLISLTLDHSLHSFRITGPKRLVSVVQKSTFFTSWTIDPSFVFVQCLDKYLCVYDVSFVSFYFIPFFLCLLCASLSFLFTAHGCTLWLLVDTTLLWIIALANSPFVLFCLFFFVGLAVPSNTAPKNVKKKERRQVLPCFSQQTEYQIFLLYFRYLATSNHLLCEIYDHFQPTTEPIKPSIKCQSMLEIHVN